MTFSNALSKTTFALCAIIIMMTLSSTMTSAFTVTSCDAPLGPIREHWVTESYCYESDTEPCCGPLRNFTTCVDDGNDPLPDVWKNGVCSGYTIFDCCFQENGLVYWNYTDCPDGQVPVDFGWYDEGVNGTSICAGLYQSSCCTELYLFTSCPPYYQKKTTGGAWSNGVCYGGSYLDCCDYDFGSSADDDYWTNPGGSDSSTDLSLVAWILIAVAICIVPCVCGCCCKRCGWYDQICRHPTVVKTRKAWKTVSNVASTVENITKSAANVTDVASTLAGDEEQTTVVVVAAASSDCDATSEHDEEEP